MGKIAQMRAERLAQEAARAGGFRLRKIQERLAQEAARAGGFRLRKIQREVGCVSCGWFDLEAAIKGQPYCCAPVKFGEMTLEAYLQGSDIRHRCHKYQRIGGPSEAKAPILDNGGRNVAGSV